jgi:hypothetical protein
MLFKQMHGHCDMQSLLMAQDGAPKIGSSFSKETLRVSKETLKRDPSSRHSQFILKQLILKIRHSQHILERTSDILTLCRQHILKSTSDMLTLHGKYTRALTFQSFYYYYRHAGRRERLEQKRKELFV